MRLPKDRLLVRLLLVIGAVFCIQQAAIADSPSPTVAPSPTSSAPASDDKAVATRAQAWFGMLQSGSIDRSQLTNTMNDALPQDKVQQLAAQLKPLGKPSSFTPIDKKLEDTLTSYRYRLTFGDTKMVFSFVLDPRGKIAGLWLTPE